MLTQADQVRIATNIWTARVIPLILMGVVGYATYVAVALLCVNYLLVKHDNKGAAIPILTVYFILFFLMAATFMRLLCITVFDPPYVELGPAAIRDRKEYKGNGKEKLDLQDKGIGMGEYDSQKGSGGTSSEIATPKDDPNSPGLELFYTKDVFVCENDGRPIWCSQCSNWKPDRAHHDSSSGRCIRKMDHFCPWVGGPVGENNYKFFIQFNFYTALYCCHLLVVMAIHIHQQNTTRDEHVSRHFWAILGLAAFFGLFTTGMTLSSLDIAASNLTQIEKLGGKQKVYLIAIKKPSSGQIDQVKPSVVPSPVYREVTYPLGADYKPNLTASTAVPMNAFMGPAGEGIGPTQPSNLQDSQSMQRAVESAPQAKLQRPEQSSTEASTGAPARTSDIAPESSASAAFIPSQAQLPSIPSTERAAERSVGNPFARDLQAIRTFVIVATEPGDHPWDLGSALWNIQTVMGYSIADWLLPIRRSPCCNHEDDESQFKVGRTVDLVRAGCYFIHPDDIRSPPKLKHSLKGGDAEGMENNPIAEENALPAHDASLTCTNSLPMTNWSHEQQNA